MGRLKDGKLWSDPGPTRQGEQRGGKYFLSWRIDARKIKKLDAEVDQSTLNGIDAGE